MRKFGRITLGACAVVRPQGFRLIVRISNFVTPATIDLLQVHTTSLVVHLLIRFVAILSALRDIFLRKPVPTLSFGTTRLHTASPLVIVHDLYHFSRRLEHRRPANTAWVTARRRM